MKKETKEFWLYHSAIGRYRPATPDPITGEERIEVLEEMTNVTIWADDLPIPPKEQ